MWRIWFGTTAILVAVLACTANQPCREGTVLVQVQFLADPDHIDGLSLRYRLDDGPLIEVSPMARPSGSDNGRFALEVRSYDSHRQLLLQYAPRKRAEIIAAWEQRLMTLDPGCTHIDLSIGIPDGGVWTDASSHGSSLADAWASSRSESGDGPHERRATPDVAVDLPSLESSDPAVDVPVAPLLDAQSDCAGLIDVQESHPIDAPLLSPVDASLDWPIGPETPSNPPYYSDALPEVCLDSTIDRESQMDASADLQPNGCLIGSIHYAPMTANPANPCEICQPGLSASAWTRAGNGSGCGSGQVCVDGLCRPGCWIAGDFYQSAGSKPGNNCLYCNPGLSASDWTVEKDGTSCGSGQGCSSGKCSAGCWIGGDFFSSGVTQVGNPCQSCQPSTSVSTWTPVVDRTPCNGTQVCSSGACIECMPNDSRCRDSSVQQLCSQNRTWSEIVCAYGCDTSKRLCYPTCKPGSTQCSSGGQPQQCDSAGASWTDLPVCAAGSQCSGAGACLKTDGQTCTTDADCMSGKCSLFYRDADGDGYDGGSARLCGTTPASGWITSTKGADCCDSDVNALPGQTQYYLAERNGCGGWDYDCDGIETMLYPSLYVTPTQACKDGCLDGCLPGVSGWGSSSVPSCGTYKSYWKCRQTPVTGTTANCSGMTCSGGKGNICLCDRYETDQMCR